jgi:hypothetical protein
MSAAQSRPEALAKAAAVPCEPNQFTTCESRTDRDGAVDRPVGDPR